MSLEHSKYRDLLKDDGIRSWIANMSAGSKCLALVNFRRLGAFCKDMKTTPQNLILQTPFDLHKLLIRYVQDMEQRIFIRKGAPSHYSPGYIESTVKAVRSWLAFNDLTLHQKVRISNINFRPTVDNVAVPTPAQVAKILRHATLRSRVACAMMAYTGIRPQVLGNFSGNDGLRLDDFPELALDGPIRFTQYPAIVNIRAMLSKSGTTYITFIPQAAGQAIIDFLEHRRAKGEILTAQTDLICPAQHIKHFITAINVGDLVRQGIRRAGFHWRPYALRHYFDTQLLCAESQRKICHAYRQYFMGHRGDIDARYTTSKNALPKQLIEDMRQSYLNAMPYLFESRAESDRSTIIIEAKELEKYFENGWEFVQQLADGRIVIKQPSMIRSFH